MVKYSEGLKSFVTESFVNFLSGADSLEKDWDRFVSAWEALGGAEITKEVNDWYAEQN
jgi:putative aldouronate transport system substrate-binding protein